MGDRATCWSITINNPTDDDMKHVRQCPVPGWTVIGQIERGEEGTEHFQGMLRTPQVRFSAVKKIFPRAHIEIARDREALKKYVTKEATRVAAVDTQHIPSVFEYQGVIARQWVEEDFQTMLREAPPGHDINEIAMVYLDSLVAQHIENGQRGVEWIATNPMWRTAWKRFWRSIINREHAASQGIEARTEESPAPESQGRDSQADGTA